MMTFNLARALRYPLIFMLLAAWICLPLGAQTVGVSPETAALQAAYEAELAQLAVTFPAFDEAALAAEMQESFGLWKEGDRAEFEYRGSMLKGHVTSVLPGRAQVAGRWVTAADLPEDLKCRVDQEASERAKAIFLRQRRVRHESEKEAVLRDKELALRQDFAARHDAVWLRGRFVRRSDLVDFDLADGTRMPGALVLAKSALGLTVENAAGRFFIDFARLPESARPAWGYSAEAYQAAREAAAAAAVVQAPAAVAPVAASPAPGTPARSASEEIGDIEGAAGHLNRCMTNFQAALAAWSANLAKTDPAALAKEQSEWREKAPKTGRRRQIEEAWARCDGNLRHVQPVLATAADCVAALRRYADTATVKSELQEVRQAQENSRARFGRPTAAEFVKLLAAFEKKHWLPAPAFSKKDLGDNGIHQGYLDGWEKQRAAYAKAGNELGAVLNKLQAEAAKQAGRLAAGQGKDKGKEQGKERKPGAKGKK